MSDRSFFKAKNERFGKLLIFCSFSLFRSFWKREGAITLFDALFERMKERSLFSTLFLKERKNNHSLCRSYWKSERAKWAIAQPCSCRVEHLFILKMSDHSFIWAKNERFGKSLIFCSFLKSDRFFRRSFWKSEREIALFVTLFERAIALLVALLKRAKKEQLLICSWASYCSIALLKRADISNEQMSKWANEWMSDCPTMHDMQRQNLSLNIWPSTREHLQWAQKEI